MSQQDSELVDRVLAGDRAAAAEFVARHRHQIERHLGARVGPLLRRWAGVSDVFASLLRRLDEATAGRRIPADSPSALIGYVQGIGRRTVFSKARRDARRRRLSGRMTARAEFRTDGDRLEQHERVEELRRVLDELPQEDQQLIRLSMNGMTARQIGDLTGMTPEAVWQRLHRARKHVHARLEAN